MQQEEFQAIVLDKLNKLDRIERAIYGNGAPGLMTRTTLVEDTVKSHRKFLWLIIGSVTTILIGVIARHIFC